MTNIEQVAKLLYKRSFIFNCSYATAWKTYLTEEEKDCVTYLEAVSYLCNYKLLGD